MRIRSCGADLAGVERIVRLRAMPDDRRAVRRPSWRDIGVMIEPQDDRHARHRGSSGRARPVRPPRRRCLRPRRHREAAARAHRSCLPRSRPVRIFVSEEVVRLLCDPPSRDRRRANDRNGLDREAGLPDSLKMTADLADIAQRLENVRILRGSRTPRSPAPSSGRD